MYEFRTYIYDLIWWIQIIGRTETFIEGEDFQSFLWSDFRIILKSFETESKERGVTLPFFFFTPNPFIWPYQLTVDVHWESDYSTLVISPTQWFMFKNFPQ